MWIFYTVMIFAVTSTAYSIIVNPGDNITEGNCSGQLDYFLCNCLSSNITIDIHLSQGHYNVTKQPAVCLLENKTSMSITGSTVGDTIIECVEPFSIVFMNVQNVTISNIKMINCGDVVDSGINNTISERLLVAYFGDGFRFALLFYNATGVIISEFTMLNTLGYGIVAFNMLGEVSLYKLHIENTTLQNDPRCINHTYYSSFYCSGSGLLFAYFNSPIAYNTTLNINQSVFKNNRNFLPFAGFKIFTDAIRTGFYEVPIPVQGAGCIAIFYLQHSFDVDTTIVDTLFQNNSGTLSGTIALALVSTNKGTASIKNCTFLRNSGSIIFTNKYDLQLDARGGISFYYLVLRNAPEIPVATFEKLLLANTLTIRQCNFTETFGEAIHIETVFSTLVSVVVGIEQCMFSHNVANAGSAVIAIYHRFDNSLATGSLIVHLVNVHANNNDILPNATIRYDSTDFITGVFSSHNANFNFNCSIGCSFENNRPSVYYGRSSSLTLSGNAVFYNNSARFGGGLRLDENTVVFIYENSQIYFHQNSAVKFGGAIDVFFANTNIRSQDICPIQFLRLNSTKLITRLNETSQFKINITFQNNTASNSLQSIDANVFYVCTWYPTSVIQVNDLEVDSDGKRVSVYNKVFQFIPKENASDHLFILAYLPCPCHENNSYDAQHCLSAADNNSLKLENKVTLGQSFYVNLISLDVAGSFGYTQLLLAEVIDPSRTTNDETLVLPNYQYSRYFSINDKNCAAVEFTIFGILPIIPQHGILHLSFSRGTKHYFNFDFINCSIGFSLQFKNGVFACTCGEFFMKSDIEKDFQCDSMSGKITREDQQSWLSVVDDNVEYTRLCSPVYCNDVITDYTLTDYDILCDNNHTGRACGGCIEDYGRAFGSNSCKRCSNAWLATILLYAILGIILVMILYLLRLTVTMGTINGLIFFCNVMSINERLFFNTEDSQFLFLRVFISLINLDLGFEMCFYNEMSQIAKTGLQFVFPVYLWLLVATIIIFGRYYFQGQHSSSRFAPVPILATLILLSYSKLLRTTVSVFSYVNIHYTTKESNFSSSQQLTAWQPDANVEYIQDAHIVLFLIAVVFMLLFIIPFALAMTFPTIILRSKRMSRLFPLLDCFYAPYKDKYRYWFGLRLVLLIYLSGMESIIFSYKESLLLSSIVVIFALTVMQAYVNPFKQTSINILDLLFMSIFIVLSMITVYLYPTDSGYERVNIAVNVLGYVSFSITCLVVAFHINDAVKHTKWYKRIFSECIQSDVKETFSKLQHFKQSDSKKESSAKTINLVIDNEASDYCHYQESLLEHI